MNFHLPLYYYYIYLIGFLIFNGILYLVFQTEH